MYYIVDDLFNVIVSGLGLKEAQTWKNKYSPKLGELVILEAL